MNPNRKIFPKLDLKKEPWAIRGKKWISNIVCGNNSIVWFLIRDTHSIYEITTRADLAKREITFIVLLNESNDHPVQAQQQPQ